MANSEIVVEAKAPINKADLMDLIKKQIDKEHPLDTFEESEPGGPPTVHIVWRPANNE